MEEIIAFFYQEDKPEDEFEGQDLKSSPSSRLSSAKERFPEATDMLERIGALNDKHTKLEDKVDVIEVRHERWRLEFEARKLLKLCRSCVVMVISWIAKISPTS